MNRKRYHRNTILFGVHARLYARIAATVAAVAVIVFIIALISNPNASVMDSPEIAAVRKRGALFVGVRSDVPGFAYEGEGLEIELARRMAERIFPDKGEEAITLVEMNSRMISSRLGDGTIDVAFMLAEKGAYPSSFAYSEAYYTDTCVLAVKQGRSKMYIDKTKIGIITDSPYEKLLNTYLSSKGISARKFYYPTYDLVLSALEDDELDGVLMPGVYLSLYSEEYKIEAHGEIIGSIDYAMACSAESRAFVNIADAMLAEMRESGTLKSLISKYIGG